MCAESEGESRLCLIHWRGDVAWHCATWPTIFAHDEHGSLECDLRSDEVHAGSEHVQQRGATLACGLDGEHTARGTSERSQCEMRNSCEKGCEHAQGGERPCESEVDEPRWAGPGPHRQASPTNRRWMQSRETERKAVAPRLLPPPPGRRHPPFDARAVDPAPVSPCAAASLAACCRSRDRAATAAKGTWHQQLQLLLRPRTMAALCWRG
jgi:hypothetical protein